ncbi:hypothetical protein [Glycomyces harbinensis]|uniref:Uncharacterized protein n=1 Tax=Glycomyces harbinensis TaxID=58114 RepID=A0A1G6R7R1_9ACTN|nr:hypothetical protein [Glycomyces harbinensis]SDD00453.1 hypothetical protein SAMN05216270_101337 [Glycomyces harbinensis]
MRDIDTRVDVVLGHLKDRKYLFFGIGFRETIRYDTFGVSSARPESDRILVEVRCPACDQELLLRVDSVERTRVKRRLRLSIALVAAAVAVVGVVVSLGAEYLAEPIPLSTPLGTGLLLGFLLGGLVAGVAGFFWWEQDGVHLYIEAAASDDVHWRLDSWRAQRNTV